MRTRIKWSRSPPAMEKVGTDSGPRSTLDFKERRGRLQARCAYHWALVDTCSARGRKCSEMGQTATNCSTMWCQELF